MFSNTWCYNSDFIVVSWWVFMVAAQTLTIEIYRTEWWRRINKWKSKVSFCFFDVHLLLLLYYFELTFYVYYCYINDFRLINQYICHLTVFLSTYRCYMFQLTFLLLLSVLTVSYAIEPNEYLHFCDARLKCTHNIYLSRTKKNPYSNSKNEFSTKTIFSLVRSIFHNWIESTALWLSDWIH